MLFACVMRYPMANDPTRYGVDDTDMLQSWIDRFGELPPLEPREYRISRTLILPREGVRDEVTACPRD